MQTVLVLCQPHAAVLLAAQVQLTQHSNFDMLCTDAAVVNFD